MNTPNKLTVARVIMVPIFMAAMLIKFPFHLPVAMVIFIIAAITDLLDGHLARKYHLVTNFGKFLDPIADKFLTTAAFVGFVALDLGHGVEWILLIILFREFGVASLRMLAASQNNIIAADKWGKAKTVTQMVAIIATLALYSLLDILKMYCESAYNILNLPCVILCDVALWVSAALTIISGVHYLIKNKSSINPNK